MKEDAKCMLAGFVAGAIVAGIAGVLAVNHQVRMSYGPAAIYAATIPWSEVERKFEEAEEDAAIRHLRILKWSSKQDARFNECMVEQWWHLWGTRALERCRPILEERIPPALMRDRVTDDTEGERHSKPRSFRHS